MFFHLLKHGKTKHKLMQKSACLNQISTTCSQFYTLLICTQCIVQDLVLKPKHAIHHPTFNLLNQTLGYTVIIAMSHELHVLYPTPVKLKDE